MKGASSYQSVYEQRRYSVVGLFGCPFFFGGISITTEPVPSRFALSRSPSGKNTTLAFFGTSISPTVRNAFRANSSDSRHFSANFSSAMIFFNTAKNVTFLYSGLVHFHVTSFFFVLY